MNIDEYYTTHCVRCFMVVTADWDCSGHDMFCILCEIEMDPASYIPTPSFDSDQEAEYDEYVLLSMGIY